MLVYDKEIQSQQIGQTMLNFISIKEALNWMEVDIAEEEIIALIDKYRKKPLFKWKISADKQYF